MNEKAGRTATMDYQNDCDFIGSFLTECTRDDPGKETPGKALYARYKKWCDDGGMRSFSSIRFGFEVASRYDSYRSGGTKYLGLEIHPNSATKAKKEVK